MAPSAAVSASAATQSIGRPRAFTQDHVDAVVDEHVRVLQVVGMAAVRYFVFLLQMLVETLLKLLYPTMSSYESRTMFVLGWQVRDSRKF